jgi:signal transduction histidine kinase
MINDVLDLSRIESGTCACSPRRWTCRHASRPCCRWSRRRAAAEHRGHAERAPAHGARARRRHARQADPDNLLSNAVKYNADGGRIHIGSRSGHRDSIEIVVTDTGLGMTPSQLAQLFQPFNRLGRERSSLEGTGIGLVISQRLAELMGGCAARTQHRRRRLVVHPELPRADPDTVVSEFDDSKPTPSDYHRAACTTSKTTRPMSR